MDIGNLNRDILQYLQQESLMPEGSELKATQEAKISRVVQNVLTNVVQEVFGEHFKDGILKKFANIPYDSKLEIFKTCLGIQEGGSSESTLLQIAKLCAQADGFKTAFYIRSFGINDQATLVEIAKITLQKDASAAAYIKNFGITDQQALIEIAKFALEKNGGEIARHINKFGIEDQATLIEIAKHCAQNNGRVTSEFIKNFGIRNQQTLIEIAKLAAQNCGRGTAEFFKNFLLQDQAAIIEIAKQCAKQSGKSTAQFIQNFDISDKQALIEIAKLAAQNDGGGTAEFFKNFFIQEQSAIIEIAKQCAKQDGKGTAQFIQNFGILNQTVLSEIGAFCLIHTPNSFGTKLDKETISSFFGNAPPEALVRLTSIYDKVLDPEFINKTYLALGDGWKFVSKYTGVNTNIEILRSLVFFCLVLNKPRSLESHTIQKIVNSVLDFRVPFLKKFLLDSTLNILADNTLAEFDSFIECFKVPTKPQKAVLANIFILSVFSMQNIDNQLKNHIIMDFLANIKERDTFLTRAPKTGALIEFLCVLNDKVKVRKEETWDEFTTYTKTSTQFSQNIFLAQAALALGIDIASMKREEVRSLLAQQIKLPEGFEEILEQLRYPESLFMYVGRIYQLGENEKEHVLKTLAIYLQEVTDKTFHERRYDQSPHLKKMEELYCREHKEIEWKKFIEAWKTGLKQKIEIQDLLQSGPSTESFAGYTVENTDDHWDLFLCGTEVAGSCQRVDGDPSLNKCLLSYVVDGKIRMIAVKDTSGRIVARSIIKLLWDEKEKKPVLLMEKIYSNVSALNGIVEQMAKKEAERLNIEFVTEETTEDRQFQSYPNRAGVDYEYEDSKEVVQSLR